MHTDRRKEILDWVRLFGRDPIAIACMQKGISYYQCSFGVLAYKKVGNVCISLGTPLCEPHDQLELLQRFRMSARKVVLCYLDTHSLEILRDEPFYFAGLGFDRYVDMEATLRQQSGPLMGAIKKARKAGLELRELDPAAMGRHQFEHFERIQRAYLDNFRYQKEIGFINSPLEFNLEGKRYFFLHQQDQANPFGFIVLNAYGEAGKIRGYLLDIIRFEKNRLWGVWLSSVYTLSELLQRENRELCLGFCPLYGICRQYDNSAILGWQVRLLAHFMSRANYPSRLYQMKTIIPGVNRSRYFASYTRNVMPALSALFRASGVRLRDLLPVAVGRSVSPSVHQTLLDAHHEAR